MFRQVSKKKESILHKNHPENYLNFTKVQGKMEID